MVALVGTVKLLARLTTRVPKFSRLVNGLEELMDKLSGYRHYGDQRYLTDVSEGRFHEVQLLPNPPAIDRVVWTCRRLGKTLLIPVKSHSMNIYRQKLRHLANVRNVHSRKLGNGG